MTAAPVASLQRAIEDLRQRGIVLRSAPGVYIVNFKNGAAATEYRSDDLDDAYAYGLAMGPPPAAEPPLGPMGKRQTQRGAMYRHNIKLAARRRRREAQKNPAQERPLSDT